MDWLKLPKKVYFKRGCMPVAIRELTEIYNLKCAFLVTDAGLFDRGAVRPVEEQLRKQGMRTAEFFYGPQSPGVGPDGEPGFQTALSGLPKMLEFEPDAVIGVGGGSVMNLAKAMWLLYEHPDMKLEDLADQFGRTDSPGFPVMGEKAKLFLLSTTSGTGSECSPFIVLNDDEGRKRVIASFDLLPTVAVIDSDYSAGAPADLVKRGGLTALTQAIRACEDPGATDYILGFARDAAKIVIRCLPGAVEKWPDCHPDCRKGRENLANAAALAGMAYSNSAASLDPDLGFFPDTEAEAAPEGEILIKLADLSRHIGLSSDEDDGAAARALIDACEELKKL